MPTFAKIIRVSGENRRLNPGEKAFVAILTRYSEALGYQKIGSRYTGRDPLKNTPPIVF